MTREEAIKKVRQMSLPKETMEILETLAPELKESKDERIINQLITIVNSAGEVLLIPTNKEELISWLNKCKESLHIMETCKENPDSFTDEDERIRKDIVALILFALEDGSAVSPGSRTTKEEAPAYLEKQKEQKLVEWSEKGKLKLKEIIDIIGYSPISEDLKNEYISLLKSLRPSWKPSEE